MGSLASYGLADGVATIGLDDGKVNAMSPAMQGQINALLDRAQADGAVVVLAGRDGVLSAGFDLTTLQAGGDEAEAMVTGGFELAARLLSFPRPVVVACTGHAVAMGLFLLLSGDYRVGAEGPYRLVANEVAIGLTMPYPAVAILRHRLTPAAFNRAVTVSDPFLPGEAVGAGVVDRLVPAAEVLATARDVAARLATLDRAAHTASKLRARADVIEAIRAGIERDRSELSAR